MSSRLVNWRVIGSWAGIHWFEPITGHGDRGLRSSVVWSKFIPLDITQPKSLVAIIMNSNRLLTPNRQLVDLTGSAISSRKEIEVSFVKQTRIVIDKITRRGAPVQFTQVLCNNWVVAWMMDIPRPHENCPGAVVWGFFGPTGEITMGAGPRDKMEAQAIQFARAVVLNEVEESAAG